jgi:hypothetical protein
VAVLCGLGGCGKTSVAVEYAHRHLAELGIVWQFPAEEPTALAAGFGDLAAQLGVRGVLDAGDPVAQVHAVLAASQRDWLLIFDNAPGAGALRHVLPPAGRGRVLVTSQDPNWPGKALEVPVLSREDAAGFLQDRTNDADVDAAGELADELGGLPLALEQAAAYMLATGRSIGSYLDLFRRRRRELLARGEPTGYDKQVATTWSLAFDELERSTPSAISLLRLLAWCGPDEIPLSMLLRTQPGLISMMPAELAPLLDDPLAADEALTGLRRFSLASAPHDGLVSVHRLVQVITMDQMSDNAAEIWQQAARVVIEDAIPDDPEIPANWPVYAVLLPHAEVAFAANCHKMSPFIRFLGSSGNYHAARDLSQRVVSACEGLGAEHPETLTARANLARSIGEAGNPAAARDHYAALLPALDQVLGADHPQTLTSRANLAYWNGIAGDPAAARDHYAALLPALESLFGPEHPDSLITRANLARWTGDAGNPVAGRDHYIALIPIRERVLGAEHPGVLLDRANLARFTGAAGNPITARKQMADLLPILDRVLGVEHPNTLTARAELAYWTGIAGDPAAARDHYAALLPALESLLGPEHPNTLTTSANLARWTGVAGNPVAAGKQFADVLSIRERVLGAEHAKTIAIRIQLAYWLHEVGGS